VGQDLLAEKVEDTALAGRILLSGYVCNDIALRILASRVTDPGVAKETIFSRYVHDRDALLHLVNVLLKEKQPDESALARVLATGRVDDPGSQSAIASRITTYENARLVLLSTAFLTPLAEEALAKLIFDKPLAEYLLVEGRLRTRDAVLTL